MKKTRYWERKREREKCLKLGGRKRKLRGTKTLIFSIRSLFSLLERHFPYHPPSIHSLTHSLLPTLHSIHPSPLVHSLVLPLLSIFHSNTSCISSPSLKIFREKGWIYVHEWKREWNGWEISMERKTIFFSSSSPSYTLPTYSAWVVSIFVTVAIFGSIYQSFNCIVTKVMIPSSHIQQSSLNDQSTVVHRSM